MRVGQLTESAMMQGGGDRAGQGERAMRGASERGDMWRVNGCEGKRVEGERARARRRCPRSGKRGKYGRGTTAAERGGQRARRLELDRLVEQRADILQGRKQEEKVKPSASASSW
jgi:hypothetical protein